MGSEWTPATLGEICDFRAGSVFNPDFQGKSFGEYPFVKVSDMNLPANAVRIQDANNWISEADVKELRAKPLPPGAVVFAKIGEALRQNRLRQVVRQTIVDNNMMGAVVRADRVNQRYFYYALSKFDFSDIAQGTALPYLTISSLSNLTLEIPPMAVQSAIAHILGTLDDKIELNRRMNETLEAMARALFKSWFVDFDPVRAKAEGRDAELPEQLAELFPDEFEETRLGKIPKGWNVSTLGRVTTKIGSGATPRGGSAVYIEDGVALIRSQNVYDSLFDWDGLARITEAAAAALQGVTVEPEDILLNITGASILRTCVVGLDVLPARVNQHVCIIRPMPHVPVRYIHSYLLQPSTKAFLMGMDAGASRQAVTKAHIESVPLILPTPAILEKFAGLIRAPFSAIDNSNAQSRTLTALRDTLLPKLISGELRVKTAEKMVEAVA